MSDETLLDLVHKFAEQTPDRIALINGLTGGELSYLRLARRVDHLACGLLDAGVVPGDNILLFMEVSTDLVEVMLAVGRVGAISLPLLGPDHKPSLVNLARQLFKPKLFIFDASGIGYSHWKMDNERWRHLDEFRTSNRLHVDVPLPKADDTFYYNTSSGTTANSKIVAATHRQIITNAYACAEIQRYHRDDRHLCTFLGHQHDLFARGLVTGATSVLLPGVQNNPERLAKALVSNAITCLMGSPMTLSVLEAHVGPKLHGSRLKLIEAGGGPISEKVRHSLERKTGALCVSVFGSTETTGVVFSPPFGKKGPHHSVGLPLPGYDVTLTRDDGTKAADGEPGILVIWGEAVGKAYTYEPSSDQPSQLQNHVFRTGDVARRHRNGWYEIIGRDDVSCKILGVRVHFERIERAIRETTSIRNVVVLPYRAFLIGDILIALYEVPELATRIDTRKIRTGLDDPIFEIPRIFLPIAKIPVNSAGKINRIAARSLVRYQLRRRPLREQLKWRIALLLLRPKVFWLLCEAAYSRKDILAFAFKHPITALKILIRACRGLDRS